MQIALRWTLTLAALLMLGPAAGGLVSLLNSPEGLDTVTLLHNSAPLMGVLVLLAIGVLALVPAGVVAVVFGIRPALTTAGLVLAWAAWMMGRGDWLIRAQPTGGTLTMLAVEGALVGVVLLGLLLVLDRLTKRAGRTDPALKPFVFKDVARPPAMLAAGAAAVAAGLAAWLVAQHAMRGQAIFAAFCGGIAAGVAGRLVASTLAGNNTDAQDHAASPWPDYLGVVLIMILGPLVGLVMPGAANLGVAAVDGTLPGLLHVLPLDWAVGAVFGVPLGHAWVGSAAGAPQPGTSAGQRRGGRASNA
ncbi:MAG: hypothetical protein AAF995_01840 [Planctomycetota bacterium]